MSDKHPVMYSHLKERRLMPELYSGLHVDNEVVVFCI
jgi:hypothetical protein